MSIFKRIYGRRIPSTKMDAENPTGSDTEKDTAAVTETTEETKKPETTTTSENVGGETVQATVETQTTTETAATEATTTEQTTAMTGDAPYAPTTTTTTNGAPRSFQFGAKAKMFRDMITQHRPKFDSDQTQLLNIIGMLTLACLCSFGALGTNYWQAQGNLNVGLWNTCQELTTFTQPDTTTNITTENSTTITTSVRCTYHNTKNELDLIVADQTRIDQVQASQGLIVCGSIMYVASLIALVFAYRFINNKQTRNLNMMRNLLVAGIFTQILAFLLQLVGFFLYILTERLSTSVGLLFVYFGLALFATNVINFITIEYKAYKLRQQQAQQLGN